MSSGPTKKALVYLRNKKPRQTRCGQLAEHEEDIRTWLLSGFSLLETLEALFETHRIEVKKSLLHYYVTQNMPELMEGRKRGRPRVNAKSKIIKKSLPTKKRAAKISKKITQSKKKTVKKTETKKTETKKIPAKKEPSKQKKKEIKEDQVFFNF